MSIDPVDDALRHFSGLLRLVEEDRPDRTDYPGFDVGPAKPDDPEAPQSLDRSFREQYALSDVKPGIGYAPGRETYLEKGPTSSILPPASRFEPSALWNPDVPGAAKAQGPAGTGTQPVTGEETRLEIDPPGGHALVFSQQNVLTDRDLFAADDAVPLEAFAAQIAASEATIDEMLARVETIAAQLPRLAEGPGKLDAATLGADLARWEGMEAAGAADEDGSVAVLRPGTPDPGTAGLGDATIVVDGAAATVMPAPDLAAVAPDDGETSFVQTGGNRLVNELVTVDAMHGAAATVVLGDAVSVDAVVQINAWETGFLGAQGATVGETQATNAAAFVGPPAPAPNSHGDGSANAATGPLAWAVAVHEGDLLRVHWSEQTNLVGDEDMVTFTAGGTRTALVTGENTAFDTASIFGFGEAFDLVIVLGDSIQANFIQQINVLVNRDAITLDAAAITAGGDRLMNVAEIRSLGTEEHQTAATGIADAAQAFAEDRASDAEIDALEGLVADAGQLLRVLVVEGDLVDLTVARQTNVLGDDDTVSELAAGIEAATGSAGIHIDLNAGGNLLLNAATIIDAAGDGSVHVAGDFYSDAVLVQAELVGSDGAVPGGMALGASGALTIGDPDALANEAVAFLQDAPGVPEREETGTVTLAETSSGSADPMAAMLG